MKELDKESREQFERIRKKIKKYCDENNKCINVTLLLLLLDLCRTKIFREDQLINIFIDACRLR